MYPCFRQFRMNNFAHYHRHSSQPVAVARLLLIELEVSDGASARVLDRPLATGSRAATSWSLVIIIHKIPEAGEPGQA